MTKFRAMDENRAVWNLVNLALFHVCGVCLMFRLRKWVFELGTENNETALLGIKCLYELQDNDIMKSVSGEYFTKRHGELHLKDVNIMPVDSSAFFQFLGSSKKLERLTFDKNCQIRGEYSYRKMAELFSTEGNIISYFHWNSCGDSKYFEYFGNALKSKNCKLIELHLIGINDCMTCLSKVLTSEHCKLVVLHLIGINDGMSCLSEALMSENCKLTELKLNYYHLTVVGVAYLRDTLKSYNGKLTKLNLSHNKITDQDVEHLSEALKSKNCKLTELSLGMNCITDRGAKYLSEALKCEDCKLTDLNLNNNGITDIGAEYFSEALRSENCKLTKLSLCMNRITGQGAEHLIEALKWETVNLLI